MLLYLPTYSPWLNPIEMLWRQFRREVTHGELFPTLAALVQAAHAFFDRYNRYRDSLLIGEFWWSYDRKLSGQSLEESHQVTLFLGC